MSTKLKKKAVKMTNTRNYLALGVAMAFAVVSGVAVAQDDLDDLLADLESTKTEAPAEQKAEAAAKEVAVEADAIPETTEEDAPVAAEEEAEEPEPAEEKADEAVAEVPQPYKKQAWRLVADRPETHDGQGSDDVKITGTGLRAEIVLTDAALAKCTDDGKTPKYKLRYIRRPQPIILTDLDASGLQIDGVNKVSECELNPVLHMDILNKAIELAYATRGGKSTAQPQQ